MPEDCLGGTSSLPPPQAAFPALCLNPRPGSLTYTVGSFVSCSPSPHPQDTALHANQSRVIYHMFKNMFLKFHAQSVVCGLPPVT